MKLITATLVAAVLSLNAAADDRAKVKTKSEGTDTLTGDTVKHKSRAKIEHDGDYKEKEKTEISGVAGKTKVKRKVKAEPDGDYKEKTKVKGPDGKYQTKTKIDR